MIYHTHPSRPPGREAFDSFADLALTVRDAYTALLPHRHKFDCIVTQGVSGLIVAAPLSLRLNRPVVVVRKPDEHCHRSGRFANAADLGARCLFLDDFISGGGTYARVERALKGEAVQGIRAKIVGVYTYRHNELSWN